MDAGRCGGVPLETVFKIIKRKLATVENPAIRALRDSMVVGCESYFTHCQNGRGNPIDGQRRADRNAKNEVAGVVLVFP